MEQEFYRSRLVERHGLEVLIPEADDRDTVHRIIYDELCLGRIDADSRAAYIGIINRQVEKGDQAIIIGCTEISLLIEQQPVSIPLFETTKLHAEIGRTSGRERVCQ